MVLITLRPIFPCELCIIFPKNSYLSVASKDLIGYMQEYLLSKQSLRLVKEGAGQGLALEIPHGSSARRATGC